MRGNFTIQNETGVCIISENGEVECLTSAVLSNEEIVEMMKDYCHEPICIAIDAPLIVKNETGSREAECSLMRHKIHGHNLSIFVASRSFLTRTFGEIRGEVLLNLILREFPDIEVQTNVSKEKSTVIETFPSAVCCGIFPELYPVKYKIKKKVAYDETKYQMMRLLSRLRILEENEGIVKNIISKLEIDSMKLTTRTHKHLEYKVDAFLSAYCVFSIYKNIAMPLTFGNVNDGFITIPMIEEKKNENKFVPTVCEFEIRECQMDDYESIHKLNCDEMGYRVPIDMTKQKLNQIIKSERDKVFVATVSGTVVGYVHANDYDVIYAPHMKNIMGIAVSSEYKRQGIGKALLFAVEQWAKESGAFAVRLVSGSRRTGAHDFYRHCGYKPEKEQINFKKSLSY